MTSDPIPATTVHDAPRPLTPEFRAYLRSPLVIAHWGGSGWAGGGMRTGCTPIAQVGIRRSIAKHQDGQSEPLGGGRRE